jgi:transcriptional regulator with XRE-family HTH domain
MKTQHASLMEDPEFRRLLSVEALVAEASEVIARLMAEQNVSKADLARRLHKSRAWVTQLLSGKANMTIRTLAEVVHTLDAEVKLQTQPPGWTRSGRLLDAGPTEEVLHSSRGRWSYEQPPPIAQPTRLTA